MEVWKKHFVVAAVARCRKAGAGLPRLRRNWLSKAGRRLALHGFATRRARSRRCDLASSMRGMFVHGNGSKATFSRCYFGNVHADACRQRTRD